MPLAGRKEQPTIYVVTAMFAWVGVMSRTSESTFKAGKNVVAPNGDINAETDTRKMIHIFIPLPKTVYGGPES